MHKSELLCPPRFFSLLDTNFGRIVIGLMGKKFVDGIKIIPYGTDMLLIVPNVVLTDCCRIRIKMNLKVTLGISNCCLLDAEQKRSKSPQILRILFGCDA